VTKQVFSCRLLPLPQDLFFLTGRNLSSQEKNSFVAGKNGLSLHQENIFLASNHFWEIVSFFFQLDYLQNYQIFSALDLEGKYFGIYYFPGD